MSLVTSPNPHADRIQMRLMIHSLGIRFSFALTSSVLIIVVRPFVLTSKPSGVIPQRQMKAFIQRLTQNRLQHKISVGNALLPFSNRILSLHFSQISLLRLGQPFQVNSNSSSSQMTDDHQLRLQLRQLGITPPSPTVVADTQREIHQNRRCGGGRAWVWIG